MFLQVSVCPQGGVPGQVHTPHKYTPSWAGTPPGQVHPRAGTHPSWAGTPQGRSPWVGTPTQAGTPPRQVHLPPQCMLGYGQQAGGTHPSGMHSCYHIPLKCQPVVFFVSR